MQAVVGKLAGSRWLEAAGSVAERKRSSDHPARRSVASAPQKTRHSVRLPELAAAARERAYRWRRRAATLGIGTLAVVMAYGVIFGHNGVTAYVRKRAEANSLEQQMQQLQTENERLNRHIAHLQDDPDAIEHAAREELHYARSGEVIFNLPSAGGSASGREGYADSEAGGASSAHP